MISVCIATYNGEKYIKEQIDSILCQLDIKDEIIVSDDDSGDATISILEEYEDQRIKIIRNQNRKGVIGNFESALNNTKGDYIFLSDQDDLWLPNKVEVMIKALQNYDLAVCDAIVIDQKNDILYSSFFKIQNSGKGYVKNLIHNTYLGCCLAFKKNVLDYILPFPATIAMHDIWIGLCVELMGKSIFLSIPLVEYRRHGNNVSTTAGKSNINFYDQVKYRFVFLILTFKRKFCK